MFKLDDKEYDETKLNEKAKVAYSQLQFIKEKRLEIYLETDRLNTLQGANLAILKSELPKEEANAESEPKE